MTDNNIVIFPLLKRSKEGKLTNEVSRDQIDQISVHYMEQLRLACDNHGIVTDRIFFRDFNLVYEAFKSTLLRSVGKHHKLQEYVDSVEALHDMIAKAPVDPDDSQPPSDTEK